jgi:lysozyme family protein
MFDSTFQKWKQHVIKWEGGVGFHKDDKGGLTNKGVTFTTFTSLADKVGVSPNTKEKFLSMTDAEHEKFLRYFWHDLASADKFSNASVGAFFAEEVWGGGQGQLSYYRRRVNEVFGKSFTVFSDVIRYINTTQTASQWYEWLNLRKRERYRAIITNNPSQKVFEKGWFNRIEDFYTKFKPTQILPILIATGIFLGGMTYILDKTEVISVKKIYKKIA